MQTAFRVASRGPEAGTSSLLLQRELRKPRAGAQQELKEKETGPKTAGKDVPCSSVVSHTGVEKPKGTTDRTSVYQLMMPDGNMEDPSCPLPHLISHQPCEVGTIEIVTPILQRRKQAQRHCVS